MTGTAKLEKLCTYAVTHLARGASVIIEPCLGNGISLITARTDDGVAAPLVLLFASGELDNKSVDMDTCAVLD